MFESFLSFPRFLAVILGAEQTALIAFVPYFITLSATRVPHNYIIVLTKN